MTTRRTSIVITNQWDGTSRRATDPNPPVPSLNPPDLAIEAEAAEADTADTVDTEKEDTAEREKLITMPNSSSHGAGPVEDRSTEAGKDLKEVTDTPLTSQDKRKDKSTRPMMFSKPTLIGEARKKKRISS
jgi:hypothetical protein